MSDEQIERFLSFFPDVDETTAQVYLVRYPRSTQDASNEYLDETDHHEDTLPSQNPTQSPLLNKATMNRCARLLEEENNSHVMQPIITAQELLQQNQEENTRAENVRKVQEPKTVMRTRMTHLMNVQDYRNSQPKKIVARTKYQDLVVDLIVHGWLHH